MTIEDEINALYKQIDEKRLLLNQYNADWDHALLEHNKRFPPVLFIRKFVFEDQMQRVSFELSHNDENVVNVLRTIPGRSYSFGRNSIPFKFYNNLLNITKEFSYVKFEIDDITRKRIEEFKPPIDIKLYVLHDQETKKYTKIGVTVRNSSDEFYFVDKLRTAIYNHPTRTVYIDLVEADQILPIITLVKERNRIVEIDPSWEDYLEYEKQNKEKQKRVVDLSSSNYDMLRPFQKEGISFAHNHDLNVLNGDEMGLGKSVQSILSFELYANKEELAENSIKRICLIVCPASLKTNWLREIFKWSGHSAYLLSGTKPDALDVDAILKRKKRYYVINYDPVATEVGEIYPWVEIFNLASFDCIIVDEIHYIKNVDTKRSKSILQLKAPHKIGLSGTLVVNRPRELWAPLRFINPEYAGTYTSFLSFYEYANKAPKNLNHLRETLNKVMIRRTKKDVLPELPPINRIYREYELSDSGNKIYNLALNGLWKALDEWEDESDTEGIANIMTQLLRLKQICAKDKVDYNCDLMIELYENNTTQYRKVIAFSQFTNSPPILSDMQRRLGSECVLIDGSISKDERDKLVQTFQTDNRIKYMLCSYGTGAEGLNITAAGSIVHCDFAWTPKTHRQAEGRAYGRLSDLHTIDSYYIESSDTIEVEITNLLDKKLKVSDKVLDNADIADDSIGSIAMQLINVLKLERRKK